MYQTGRRLVFAEVCVKKRQNPFVALILLEEKRHTFYLSPNALNFGQWKEEIIR